MHSLHVRYIYILCSRHNTRPRLTSIIGILHSGELITSPSPFTSPLSAMHRLTFSKHAVSALAFYILSTTGERVLAANNAPGQPQQAQQLNGFEIIGNSVVSGQQVTARRSPLYYICLSFDPRYSWAPKTRSISSIKRKETRRQSMAIPLGLQVRFDSETQPVLSR